MKLAISLDTGRISKNSKGAGINIHGAFILILIIQKLNANANAISLLLWMRDSFSS